MYQRFGRICGWSVCVILVLVVMGMISLHTAATTYDGTVPHAEDDIPGLLVRYIELETDDKMDWSWKSPEELDFTITIPSENISVESRKDKVSQAGHFVVETKGVHRFAWYNNDADVDVELEYTIHMVQNDPVLLILLVIATLGIVFGGYALWFKRRISGQDERSLKRTEDGGSLANEMWYSGLKKAAIIGAIVGLIAISTISLVYLPKESPSIEKGSELVVIIENTSPDTHVVRVTARGSGPDEVVQVEQVELLGGETEMLLFLASPEWMDTELTISVSDRTVGTTTSETWTPTVGKQSEIVHKIV